MRSTTPYDYALLEDETGPAEQDIELSDRSGTYTSTNFDAYKEHSVQQDVDPIQHVADERKLVRKLDIVILPFAMLLYTSAYLDRGNLGNARLQGLQKDVLGDEDAKFSFALSCFFITYITLSIPGTLLAKAISPSISIACGALIWSIGATAQAGVQGASALYMCRLLVGTGEAMFGQAMSLYFTFWYKKSEIATRVGLFIACGALAGAFGGLIAYAVQGIPNPPFASWRILFLLEGFPSLLLAISVFLFLPSRPEDSRYLSRSERSLASLRLAQDSSSSEAVGINWQDVRDAFRDWKIHVMSIMYSCMNFGLSSVSGFLPTIIKGLGYTNAQAQLLTVPPYAVTVVFMYCVSSYSDTRQSRGLPAAGIFLMGALGWTILHSVDAVSGSLHVRYFACVLVVMAGLSAIPIIVAWQANNCATESGRAVALGMLNTIGQCLSIAASYSFPSSDSPQFSRGTTLNILFQCLGCCIAMSMRALYRRENDRLEHARASSMPASQKHPTFRYIA